jgi:hypothetical protein
MTDLNDLIPTNSGWMLASAQSINDNGFILCDTARNSTGQWGPCLLAPIGPVLRVASLSNGSFSLTWDAIQGQSWQIQYRTNLAQTPWLNFGGVVTATNGTIAVAVGASTDTRRFFRVVTVP